MTSHFILSNGAIFCGKRTPLIGSRVLAEVTCGQCLHRSRTLSGMLVLGDDQIASEKAAAKAVEPETLPEAPEPETRIGKTPGGLRFVSQTFADGRTAVAVECRAGEWGWEVWGLSLRTPSKSATPDLARCRSAREAIRVALSA